MALRRRLTAGLPLSRMKRQMLETNVPRQLSLLFQPRGHPPNRSRHKGRSHHTRSQIGNQEFCGFLAFFLIFGMESC